MKIPRNSKRETCCVPSAVRTTSRVSHTQEHGADWRNISNKHVPSSTSLDILLPVRIFNPGVARINYECHSCLFPMINVYNDVTSLHLFLPTSSFMRQSLVHVHLWETIFANTLKSLAFFFFKDQFFTVTWPRWPILLSASIRQHETLKHQELYTEIRTTACTGMSRGRWW